MSISLASLNLMAAWPLLVVALGAVALLAIEALGSGFGRRYGPWVAAGSLLVSLLTTVRMWPGQGYGFFAMMAADAYTLFLWALLAGVALLVVLLSDAYHDEWSEAVGGGDYYILLLLATCGMMLMVAGTNLLVIFLGLEVLSVAVYVLAGILRDRPLANEAGLKYLLLGAFASAFLLYGIALVFGATGSFDLMTVASQAAARPDDLLLLVGVALLIVGLGFKAALVPFHMWAPDVYQGAPAAISGFMSVGPKAAALAVLLRVLVGGLPSLHPDWGPLLWALAVASMTVGNVVAIAQTDVKRMLAYSSIAHAGYALVAVVAASPQGSEALLYYLTAYAFLNLGAFGVVLIIAPGGTASQEVHTTLADYAGLGWRQPYLGLALAVFLFGLAGIPPTAGFAAKFYAFNAAVQSGQVWLAVIGVLNSLVSVYFYLRLTVMMYMREPETVINPLNPPPGAGLALTFCLAATLLLGLFPAPVLSLAREAVRFLV